VVAGDGYVVCTSIVGDLCRSSRVVGPQEVLGFLAHIWGGCNASISCGVSC